MSNYFRVGAWSCLFIAGLSYVVYSKCCLGEFWVVFTYTDLRRIALVKFGGFMTLVMTLTTYFFSDLDAGSPALEFRGWVILLRAMGLDIGLCAGLLKDMSWFYSFGTVVLLLKSLARFMAILVGRDIISSVILEIWPCFCSLKTCLTPPLLFCGENCWALIFWMRLNKMTILVGVVVPLTQASFLSFDRAKVECLPGLTNCWSKSFSEVSKKWQIRFWGSGWVLLCGELELGRGAEIVRSRSQGEIQAEVLSRGAQSALGTRLMRGSFQEIAVESEKFCLFSQKRHCCRRSNMIEWRNQKCFWHVGWLMGCPSIKYADKKFHTCFSSWKNFQAAVNRPSIVID